MQKLHACITLLLLAGVGLLAAKLMMRHDDSLITVAQARAVDASQPVARRLEALQMLRSHGFAEPYLCTEEVVQSMLQLASQSKVPEVRADIYRQLNGIDYPIICEPLIEALLNDASSEVREEAARSLGLFREDSDVKSALSKAQEEDASELVQKQAAASLAGESGWMTSGTDTPEEHWESEQ